MRAVVYDRYGPPDVLRVEDVPIPSPGARAGPDPGVRDVGQPERLGRPARGRRRTRGSVACAPRARRTLGSDIAGVVEAVGPGVTRFRTGDEVYGDNLGLKGRLRRVRSRGPSRCWPQSRPG